MEKWVLIVEVNCKDAKREAEFNDWYDKIHIPDILNGSPGFKSATRYVIKDPTGGRGKYIALYEIETDDIKRTMDAHAKNVQSKRDIGRGTDLSEMVSRRLCHVQ